MRSIKPILLVTVLCISVIASSQADTAQVNREDSLGSSAFTRVDQEAFFPGGETAWKKFLEKNLNAEVPIKNGAPAGVFTVTVLFMVDSTGKVSGIKALTNLGYGMENEVIRLLKKADHWMPAILKQKPVNAYRKQPVSFQVIDDGFDISSSPAPYTLLIGTDNEITLNIVKSKTEDFRLTISQGTITRRSDGKYIVRVTKPGRAVIDIYNKKNKKIGAASFEVKTRDN